MAKGFCKECNCFEAESFVGNVCFSCKHNIPIQPYQSKKYPCRDCGKMTISRYNCRDCYWKKSREWNGYFEGYNLNHGAVFFKEGGRKNER